MKKIILTILITSNLIAQFTNYNCKKLKLVSDSKIYINNNSKKLIADSPITGEFYLEKYLYKHGIINITCNKSKKIYQIVNECKLSILGISNELYTRKNRIKDIENMDTDNHMLECKYNKKHGIMHDCDVKIYRYKFK